MNLTTRQKFVWGWLRLFLGFLQMALAATSLGVLITLGLHPLTYACVIATTAATLTSRLLYHGRSGPEQKPKNSFKE